MKPKGDARTRAEAEFHRWLDLLREGRAPEDGDLVAAQPDEIQGELRQMIADYHELKRRLGEGSPALKPGRVLGDYSLVREIGRGGMAVVWEAEQISLRRAVALKLLSPHFALSPNALARFEREARAGGRLAHPGIVQTYGVGAADGIHFIAQELVPGGCTLADSLAELREAPDLPEGYFRRVAALFARVAEALAFAHERGVIHRDVKPSNILIAEHDEPKVTDFGLARIQDELSLSRTGELEGTPFYMSPEQAAGRSMGIDHRTDVFSLGSTLYEALTLVRVFDGETSQQVFRKILTVSPQDPRKLRAQVPRDLSVISLKCLEKDPERRYAGMHELREDLVRFLESLPIHARPVGPLGRAERWARRNPGLSVFTVASVAVAFMSLGGYQVLLRQQRESRRFRDATISATSRAERLSEEALITTYAAKLQSAVLALESGRVAEAHRLLDDCPEDLRGWEWHHVQFRADASLAVIRGHQAGVQIVAFARGGERIVSADRRGALRHWDAASGDLLLDQPIDGGPFTYSTVTSDASGLITMGSGDLRLRSIDTGETLAVIDVGENWTGSATWSPLQGRVLLGSRDGVMRLQSVPSGAELARVSGEGAASGRARFSASGRFLAWASDGGTLAVLDGLSGEELRVLEGHRTRITAFEFDASEERLATGSEDGDVVVWDRASGEPLALMRGHEREVELLAFTPDSKQLASASADGFRRLWEVRSGRPIALLEGQCEDVTCIAFDPRGRLLATGDRDGAVYLWDAKYRAPATVQAKLPLETSFPAQAPGRVRELLGDRASLLGFDPPPVKPPLAVLLGHESGVSCVAFSEDGGLLVSGDDGGSLRLFDARVGPPFAVLSGLENDFTCAAFSPGGSRVLAGTQDGALREFDSVTGELLAVHRVDGSELTCIAVHADGARVAVGFAGGSLAVLDLETGEVLARFHVREDELRAVAFDPDGRRIAAGWEDGMVEVLDASSGEELARMAGHEDDVTAIAWSPDGARLATAARDEAAIRIWDATTGEPTDTLDGHSDEVLSLAFMSESELLSGSEDGSARVWRVVEGRVARVALLEGHADDVAAVARSSDGQRVLSASKDSTLRVWWREMIGETLRKESLLSLDLRDDDVVGASFSPDNWRILCGTRRCLQIFDADPHLAREAGSAWPLRQMHRYVQSLHDALILQADVESYIHADPSLDVDERATALRISRALGDPPADFLAELALDRAWTPSNPREATAAALRCAEAAIRLEPGARFQALVLALAQHRDERPEDALATTSALAGTTTPEDLACAALHAVRAMALFELGHEDQARESLARAQQAASGAEAQGFRDHALAGLVREAADLIEAE